MTEALLVIDGRHEGLPHAHGYYVAFPQEPSPFGETLTFTEQKTKNLTKDVSLFTALPELAGAGAGGIAVVVCHAYGPGMLLPLAPGGTTYADAEALPIVDKAMAAEADVAKLRLLPKSTQAERNALLARWRDFLNGLESGLGGAPQAGHEKELEDIQKLPRSTDAEKEIVMVAWRAFLNRQQKGLGEGLSNEAEAQARFELWDFEIKYDLWIKLRVKKLQFHDVVQLRQFFERVLAMRAAKLERLELRACNVGRDNKTMEMLRKFFGCSHISAPTAGTFFAAVPVAPLLRARHPQGVRGSSTAPHSVGSGDYREITRGQLLLADRGTRGFLLQSAVLPRRSRELASPSYLRLLDTPDIPEQLGGSAGSLAGVLGYSFFLRISETSREYHYSLSAWAGAQRAPAPDPAIINEFAAASFDPKTKFGLGVDHTIFLPLAGLYTPNGAKPFVLPREREYLTLFSKI